MERWYRGLLMRRSNPRDKMSLLFRQVQQLKLGNLVAYACHERGALDQPEYFLFIGIESEGKGIVPQEYSKQLSTLIQLLKPKEPTLYDCDYTELSKSFVSQEVEGQSYRQVKPLQLRHSATDVFSLIAPVEIVSEEDAENYNLLLYWLSAHGQGTQSGLTDACHSLTINDDPRHIARRLRLLGNMESMRNGQRWVVTPSCLIQPDPSISVYYWAGQRTPAQIQQLELLGGTIEPIYQLGAPTHLRIEFSTASEAQQAAKQMGLHLVPQVAISLAKALPLLSSWRETLENLDITLGRYELEKWEQNRFIQINKIPDEIGFYRLTNSDTKYQWVAYHDPQTGEWRRGDWYGLRYLAASQQESIMLFHKPSMRQLRIHLNHRPPEIYERILVLASGLLPKINHQYLQYENIGVEIATEVAEKLHARYQKEDE